MGISKQDLKLLLSLRYGGKPHDLCDSLNADDSSYLSSYDKFNILCRDDMYGIQHFQSPSLNPALSVSYNNCPTPPLLPFSLVSHTPSSHQPSPKSSHPHLTDGNLPSLPIRRPPPQCNRILIRIHLLFHISHPQHKIARTQSTNRALTFKSSIYPLYSLPILTTRSR
jgi:hypothetical protein